MRWDNASKWFRNLSQDEISTLLDSKAENRRFPINDKLFNPEKGVNFMDDNSRIILLYGGRGGGKSNSIALRLIEEAVTEKYFKCYYGRQVFDRVRGSQHQEIIKAIEQLKYEDRFDYSKSPNGSLTITCKKNSNSFYAFGGDNPQSMKSISDPTHIWMDELDQFYADGFRAIFPTVRTIRGKNILIGSFNSYEVLKDHWLVKYFFPDIYEGADQMDYNALDGISVSKYLINFRDNYFINQEEYDKQLRISAGGDMDLYDGLANGEWGLDKKGDLWYHAFKKGLHVGHVERLPLPDHLGFDFNLVPYMTLLLIQINETDSEFQIRIPKEYCLSHPRNTTEAVCYAYLNDWEGSITDVYYYGDAMGTRGVEGFGDDFTRFDPVRSVLFRYLYEGSDRTTRRNIGVNKRRNLINRILSGNAFYGEKKVRLMIDEGCRETIKDLQHTKEGVQGKHKEKVKDTATGRTYEKFGHASDVIDYVCSELLDFLLE